MDQGERHDQKRRGDARERPQPEYRVSLTLAVTDPQALWAAAAARLLAAPDMTLDDVLDVIGPHEDPSITECIAALAKPTALAGCMLDDFWIDGLRGCPPRADVTGAAIGYKPAPADAAPRRVAPRRRPAAHLSLSLLPPPYDEAPTN